MRAIADAGGQVIQTYQTDEFGILLQSQGSSTQPFQYTGEQHDAESGFYYLRGRMYDPAVGRFLSRDTVFGRRTNPKSQHRLSYVGNNPATFIDPSGHSAIEQALAVCAAQGLNCEGLTHDMAVELLSGGRVHLDWFDVSAFTEGSPIDQIVFVVSSVGSGGVIKAIGLIGRRVASSVFGRSVQSVQRYVASGEGPWSLFSAHAQPAEGTKYVGGISIEEIYLHAQTGERVVVIWRGQELLHETFRTYSKFGR